MFVLFCCCFFFFPPATPGRLNDLLMNEIMDVKSVTYLVRMPSQPDSVVFILSPLTVFLLVTFTTFSKYHSSAWQGATFQILIVSSQ